MSSPRVAVLSVHTSPLDQPGSGDSGGMNVYIRAVAERLAERDVEVDLFTRCRGTDGPEVLEIAAGVRVVSVKAGPCTPVPKSDLPRFLPEFLGGVLRRASVDGRGYDILHSHYWLSGWVGSSAKDIWGVPLVASFHTLGKVKNYSLARGEPPEPSARLLGEERVIADADRILAPTPAEAAQLVGLYRANPEHIRIVPPGVDHTIFFPRERHAARERLHLTGLRLALYVGRLQPHKGPDIAVRTLAEAVARDPDVTRDLMLAIVGGPSGTGQGAEVAHLMELAAALGVSERVMLFPPLPQARLADVYAAADVVLVPSRSESFGLVALEAQACGTPVVVAAVGGLRFVVRDGQTGFLVEGHDPADHAERMLQILRDPALAAEMGTAAAREALRFTWDATSSELAGIYRELVAGSAHRP
jgi:D-inositol-3-phosphate glycosyltransferase